MTRDIACWIDDSPEKVNQGHAFGRRGRSGHHALDEFKARIDGLIRSIKESPKAKGSQRITCREMEWERRERAAAAGHGLPDDVWANLEGVAADTGRI